MECNQIKLIFKKKKKKKKYFKYMNFLFPNADGAKALI